MASKYNSKLFKIHEYLNKHEYERLITHADVTLDSTVDGLYRCHCGKLIYRNWKAFVELNRAWNTSDRRSWGRIYNTKIADAAINVHFKLKEGKL